MEHTTEREYFIILRGEQAGPFTRDELRGMPVHRHTPVWNEEKWLWTPAEAVATLADLFSRADSAAGGHSPFRNWLRTALGRMVPAIQPGHQTEMTT